MLDFQNKKRIRKILYSPVFLILLGVILFSMLRGVWNVYKKERLSMENLKQEQVEHDKLIARQNNLASSLEYLKTEDGIESEIRSKFRAIKDGEQVTVIIDNSLPPLSPATTTIERGFWYNLFH